MNNNNEINITLCNSQNSVDALVNDAILKKNNSDQEKINAYKNSMYYQAYLNYCNNISNVAGTIMKNIYDKYCYNKYLYINPFNKKIDYSLYIKGIGYPIPDEYILNIKNIYQDILNKENIFTDGEFNIDIISAEYLKSEEKNLIKKEDSYIVYIELKQKEIENINLKTK